MIGFMNDDSVPLDRLCPSIGIENSAYYRSDNVIFKYKLYVFEPFYYNYYTAEEQVGDEVGRN